MKSFLFGILFSVGFCGCVLAENDATNSVSDDVVSNSVPVVATNPMPVAVEAPVVYAPPSEEMDALFSQLRGCEADCADLLKNVLIAGLSERQGWLCARELRRWILRRADGDGWAEGEELSAMLFAAACVRCLEAFEGGEVPAEVWKWLFGTKERVQLVSGTIVDEDNTLEAARIIAQLYQHDPESRDRYLNLILAMAVVWDTPRKAMDDQLEPGWQAPDEDICRYYDYFKKLYSSTTAKVSYDELSVDSLVFVVDVPAPVSEMEWALEHVTGTRGSWGRHYQDITYDHLRILRKQYDWPHKEYTLQEIQECFGICVDQAYYCVLTARAYGIPSLFFRGHGKFGGHAWFGFMKKPNEWDLEVGRYSEQGYAIGFAVHPQADYEMSDHELEYVCSRSLNPEISRKAWALIGLARILYEEDCGDSALLASRQALQVDPKNEAAWEIQCDILSDAARYEEAIAAQDEMVDVFRFFPDLIAEASMRQAHMMDRAGDAEGAEALLKRQLALAHSKRSDLQQTLVIALADQLLRMGDAREGMEAIEKMLQQQRSEGFKTYFLMKNYKGFAKRAGCKDAADRFLKSY